MSHMATQPTRKALLLVVPVALIVVILAGLVLSAPAAAQGPEDALDVIPGDSLASKPALQAGPEPVSPAGDVPPPGSTGSLHVHVYDWLTEQPLGGRVISIYDRNGEPVAQETTTCHGYIQLEELPSGPYRVRLEPDLDWTTVRRFHFPGGRNTPGEWVWVRPYWRAGVRFFEAPNVGGAGLRVYAYHASSRQANRPREALAGAAFTVYDSGGNFVANGITGCGGFVDFNNLSATSYRVVDANQPEGEYIYPPSGERWVSLEYGAVTSTWFFTVPSPGPEATPTLVP